MTAEVCIPAEQWEGMARSCSALLVAEHQGTSPVPVKACRHQGHLYAVFGVVYGPLGAPGARKIIGWRLLPEQVYDGEVTTLYIDEEAIRQGRRDRGDHTGLLVNAKYGRQRSCMICTQKVVFLEGLPTTRPVFMEDAKRFDAESRQDGWRAIYYSGRTAYSRWYSLKGHPVVRYICGGKSQTALFWRCHDGGIEELWLDESVELESDSCCVRLKRGERELEQISLF